MVFSGERERTINWHSILKDLEAKLDHTKVQGGLMWNSTTTKIGRKKIKEEKVYGPLETNIRHNAYISSHSFHFFSSLRQTEQSLFLPTFPKWVELYGRKRYSPEEQKSPNLSCLSQWIYDTMHNISFSIFKIATYMLHIR